MSVAKAYTTEAKVEAYTGKAITAGAADDAINAAVAFIDRQTGRNFIAASTASARLFNGNDQDVLTIDECVEVTKVEVGQDEYGDVFQEVGKTTADRYYTMPARLFDGAGNAIPIRQLHLRSRFWSKGFQNHRITAKWGYSVSVPEGISYAATIIAAGIYNAFHGGTADVKSESIGNYSVTYDTESGWSDFERAKEIIATFRLMTL